MFRCDSIPQGGLAGVHPPGETSGCGDSGGPPLEPVCTRGNNDLPVNHMNKAFVSMRSLDVVAQTCSNQYSNS